MTPGYTEGTITFIANGARNPYLVDNGNLGWVNDDDVVSCSEHSSEDSDRLTPQQIAYEICFGDNRWGDYPDRKEKLKKKETLIEKCRIILMPIWASNIL